jgi:CRISPR-associated protein Csb3
MTEPTPTIRVKVDPCNPGQYFGCCGLLELADRLWQGAWGWFAEYADEFCLAPQSDGVTATADDLLDNLARCRLTNTMTEAQVARLEQLRAMSSRERERVPGLDDEKKALEKLHRDSPLVLHEPFKVQIDWFADDLAGGSRFKTWAGMQSVRDIGYAMKRPLETDVWKGLPPDRWFPQTADDDSVPFNFDSDLGGQASAIDMGFSGDPLQMSVRTRPMIEIAAFIGLQRFRPYADADENRYTFVCWREPLPPLLASVAACGTLKGDGSRVFEFRLLYRTKYLKSFLPAQSIGGPK